MESEMMVSGSEVGVGRERTGERQKSHFNQPHRAS